MCCVMTGLMRAIAVVEVRREVSGQVTHGHVLTTFHLLSLVGTIVIGIVSRMSWCVLIIGVRVSVVVVVRMRVVVGRRWMVCRAHRTSACRQLLLSLARSELVTRGVLGQFRGIARHGLGPKVVAVQCLRTRDALLGIECEHARDEIQCLGVKVAEHFAQSGSIALGRTELVVPHQLLGLAPVLFSR